jgi:hypothetical protein
MNEKKHTYHGTDDATANLHRLPVGRLSSLLPLVVIVVVATLPLIVIVVSFAVSSLQGRGGVGRCW